MKLELNETYPFEELTVKNSYGEISNINQKSIEE